LRVSIKYQTKKIHDRSLLLFLITVVASDKTPPRIRYMRRCLHLKSTE